MLAATFTLTNCTKEFENPSAEPEGVPFEIVASTVDTKTANDGMSTKWVADDAINLFHAVAGTTTYGTNDKFIITSENLAANKFTGELTEGLASGNYDWYALYPYNDKIATPGEKTDGYTYIGYSSGLNQTGYNSMASLKGSVCPLYGVAKAVPADETPDLTMEHLSSVVAIKITNANEEPLTVANASFTATEDIVGSYFIDITKTPVAYTAKTAYETATVTVTDGATPLAKGESATLYLAIKPFKAASGKKLTLSVNGYSKTITLPKDVTFSAGKIKTLNFSYDKPADPAAKSVTWDLTKSSYSSATETEVQWVSADIKMTLEKNTSTTVANNYLGGSNSHTRVYKGQILTFTPEDYASINRIEFVSTTKDYADKFVAATWTNAEVESNSNIVVAVPSDASNPVSVKIGDATRFTSITVYYELTAEPPTLVSISISGDYVTEFTEGDEFSFGGVVTATYDDASTKDVTAEATFSGYDMDVTGNQTVTVTYKDKSITYLINVADKPNNAPIEITLNLSQNIFNFNTSKSNGAESEITKTYNDYSYKFKASESLYYFGSKALFIGKKDSYITFPAIDNYKLVSVEAHNCSGASSKGTIVICGTENTTAVSGGTSSTITAGSSKTWTLSNTDKNTAYRFYITNANAVQLTKIVLTYNVD